MNTLHHHWNHVPASTWRWPNFMPVELASHGDGSLLVDEHALDCLQQMRRIIGRPLVINSAYRDPIHNAKVGGAALSMHKFGKAFDVSLRGHNKWTLIQAAEQAGFTGMGINYNSFLHVDTGRKRRW